MIHRRGFLTAGLGLGIGNGMPGANQPAAEYDSKHDIPPVHPEFVEYERILAQTTYLPALGIPRSWSVVREGFHPVSPERVVIMKAGQRRDWRAVHERIRERIRMRINDAYWEKRPTQWTAKLDLIVQMVHQLTDYYHMPECLDTVSLG